MPQCLCGRKNLHLNTTGFPRFINWGVSTGTGFLALLLGMPEINLLNPLYGFTTANMSHKTIMLYGHIDPTFCMCAKTPTTAICTSHVTAMYVPVTNIPLKFHKYAKYPNLFMCTWHSYIIINTSYEITTINSVTRRTGIHTFPIIGTCPKTNIFVTLHIHAPLYYCCSLHTDFTYIFKKPNNCNLWSPSYYHMCASNKYAPPIPYICHMPKLHNMHQWGSLPIDIQYMNSLASTIWCKVLYTKDNDASTHYDDDTAQLHNPRVKIIQKSVLSRIPDPPKMEIVENQSSQVHHTLPK